MNRSMSRLKYKPCLKTKFKFSCTRCQTLSSVPEGLSRVSSATAAGIGSAEGRAGSATPGLGVLGDFISWCRSRQVQRLSLHLKDHKTLGASFRRPGTNFLIQEGKNEIFSLLQSSRSVSIPSVCFF